MTKDTGLPPPTPYRIGDYNVKLRTKTWFTVLSDSLGDAIKKAVDAGMPPHLAEEIYKQALQTAVPESVSVIGGVG